MVDLISYFGKLGENVDAVGTVYSSYSRPPCGGFNPLTEQIQPCTAGRKIKKTLKVICSVVGLTPGNPKLEHFFRY